METRVTVSEDQNRAAIDGLRFTAADCHACLGAYVCASCDIHAVYGTCACRNGSDLHRACRVSSRRDGRSVYWVCEEGLANGNQSVK